MHLTGTAAGSRQYFSVLTAGVNYYFYGHRLKLTNEIMYLPQGLPLDDSGGDVLTSSKGHGEFSFVSQLQLLL